MGTNKLKNIFKSEFIRNSTVLVSGNAGGQVISLLTYPILSRIYTKEDFGAFALFLSLTGVLSILSTGKYEEAFVLTHNKRESSSLLNFTLRLLLISSIILFVFLAIFRDSFFVAIGMEAITPFWYMISPFILFSGIFAALTNLSNKEKFYKSIASSNLTLNALSSLFKVGFKYILPGATGLISGQLAGQVFSCSSFYKLKGNLSDALKCKWSEAKAAGKQYIVFPKYNMPRGFINSLSGNLPFFVLSGAFGEARLGLFFLALNLSFRPINLLSNSIYQVVFEKTARLKHDQQHLSHLFNHYWKQCAIWATPAFVVIFVFAPYLFKIIFGTGWEESGVYLRYILPWMFMVLFTTPMGFLPLLFNKQKTAMYLELFYLPARFLALYYGIYLNDFNLAILLFTAVGFIYMLVTFLWYKTILKKYERNIEHD